MALKNLLFRFAFLLFSLHMAPGEEPTCLRPVIEKGKFGYIDARVSS